MYTNPIYERYENIIKVYPLSLPLSKPKQKQNEVEEVEEVDETALILDIFG